jgi:DedD protein
MNWINSWTGMDDKLKRRLAGAAVLLLATFVVVSLLPTPEQAAQQPDVDVVTIPLHDVVSSAPPPPAASSTPPTLAAPPAHDGDGTDAQEVDIAGDDDGSGDAPDARKPVQLALDSSLQPGADKPAEPARPNDKPLPPPAAKPIDKPAEKAAVKPVEKSAAKPAEPAVAAAKPTPKPADKAVDKAPDKPAAKPSDKPADKPAAAAAAAGSWSVQVGGFADIGNARQVQDKLKTLGQPSFLSPIDTAKGTLYRVRAGPYATREAAQAALGKLSGGGYPEARVVGP